MSKAERLREATKRIFELQNENQRLKEKLSEYRKRDEPRLGDFLKKDNKAGKQDE